MEPKIEEEVEEEEGEKERRLCVWDCGSPLYDAFELVSVCHLIDRHVVALPFAKERVDASSARFEHAALDAEAATGGRRRRRRKMLVVMGRRGKKEVAKMRRKVRVRLHGVFEAIYTCLLESTMKCL